MKESPFNILDNCNEGKFIVFEGGEGCGKTTQILKLVDYLTSNGIEVVSTREPGGLSVPEQIRQVILSVDNEMDGVTESLLYAAARHEHLRLKVVKALQSGKTVICDRFVHSSLCYQQKTRGINGVLEINKMAITIDGREYWPNKVIYLDQDPVIGLERIHQNRTGEINRLDLEGLEFHQKVRQGYLELAEEYKDMFVTINAAQSIEKVHEDILTVVKQELGI